jgi:hypothetical protein
MSYQFLVVHRTVDAGDADFKLETWIWQLVERAWTYISLHKLIDGCEDILMTRHIVQGTRPIFFYPG